MNTSELQRKATILWLSLKITALRLAMSWETGVTDQWKRMARAQGACILQRQALMTPDEIRRIERRRGLL
ncbi:hypothetical protein [Marinobacter sp. OP 3.4]|uniref:hypothetical protein n=1 Tax=Marinobacter sp. OP 3.4 TaxID=3076501 RepID=UPI002E1C3C1A